jgi:hypothetical protein
MRAAKGSTLKRVTRILVLALFAALLAIGRLRFWAIALGLGLVIEAIRPGRLYCMWLCPIRAAHGLAGTGLYARKKGAIKALGWVFIAIFLALFGISMALGIRGWLFPCFVAIGTVLSFELSLQTWCSSCCPFGMAFVTVRMVSARMSAWIRAMAAASRREVRDRGEDA